MRRICVKCGRSRNTVHMVQAVFVDKLFNEPVDVWKCGAVHSCKQYRKNKKSEK